MNEGSHGHWAARLRRFAASPPALERCDICGGELAARHQHLLEIASARLLCVCRACSRTFAESERFRILRPSTQALSDFRLEDWDWEAMQLPIDLAFLLDSTREGGPIAFYPGPAGAVASPLSHDAWSRLTAANPPLAHMSPDVEALLINRTKGVRRYYLVSIDRCYALVGLIRTQWRGFSGGAEVWESLGRFFAALDAPGDEGVLTHG
jgi:hypothetical protein